jgi:TonB family protein
MITSFAALLLAAVPTSNPGGWISTDDYPEEALASELEGTVEFVLVVGKDGSVNDCKIVGSSGHDFLDAQTCSLLAERARFEPADASSTYRSRVAWRIPPTPKMTLETQGVYAIGSFSPDGEMSGCVDGKIGDPVDAPNMCSGLRESDVLSTILGDDERDFRQLELRMFYRPASLPDPALESAGDNLRRIELVRADFVVDKNGHGRECSLYATDVTPPQMSEFCEVFDQEKADFVADANRTTPVPMQLKVELVITPRR